VLRSVFRILIPLISFLLLFLDPPLSLMHLLIHTQPFLLSFESITWRWSKELTMICSIYAPLFAISGPVSMIPTVGTLSLFHFREATRSLFLYRVLRLIHGYLLQLLLRHRLLQKIPTFRRIDPFCWWQKGGEILWSYLWELSWVFMCLSLFEFLFMYFLFVDM